MTLVIGILILGMFNRHNYRHWAEENPHEFRSVKKQQKFSINVWCGIINDCIVGPYLYEDNLTAENFLNFLRNGIEDYLDDISLANRQLFTILQLDGAGAHTARIVKNYLDERYERWIGTNGPMRWPPRSPDLTPLDFFLWGAVKDYVYNVEITDRNQLIDRINRSITIFSADSIRSAVRKIEERCRKCMEQEGLQFEHLMKK